LESQITTAKWNREALMPNSSGCFSLTEPATLRLKSGGNGGTVKCRLTQNGETETRSLWKVLEGTLSVLKLEANGATGTYGVNSKVNPSRRRSQHDKNRRVLFSWTSTRIETGYKQVCLSDPVPRAPGGAV
jgi:hypothetical protein